MRETDVGFACTERMVQARNAVKALEYSVKHPDVFVLLRYRPLLLPIHTMLPERILLSESFGHSPHSLYAVLHGSGYFQSSLPNLFYLFELFLIVSNKVAIIVFFRDDLPFVFCG